jgi:signal transduction histidine kinase
MSHELRTPLNAIIGVSEMLREDAEALKQDLEPLDRVLGAARHLLALINDILDLSKIEAGRMELHLETFPVRTVINDVAKTIEPMAAKNGNRIVIDCPSDLGTIHADQTRLRQALLNLASNANKFTEDNTVSIAAQPQRLDGRDWIALAVTDTGIGMTPEQMGNPTRTGLTRPHTSRLSLEYQHFLARCGLTRPFTSPIIPIPQQGANRGQKNGEDHRTAHGTQGRHRQAEAR